MAHGADRLGVHGTQRVERLRAAAQRRGARGELRRRRARLWSAGWFNDWFGNDNSFSDNGNQYTGRISVLPVDAGPQGDTVVQVGASVYYREAKNGKLQVPKPAGDQPVRLLRRHRQVHSRSRRHPAIRGDGHQGPLAALRGWVADPGVRGTGRQPALLRGIRRRRVLHHQGPSWLQPARRLRGPLHATLAVQPAGRRARRVGSRRPVLVRGPDRRRDRRRSDVPMDRRDQLYPTASGGWSSTTATSHSSAPGRRAMRTGFLAASSGTCSVIPESPDPVVSLAGTALDRTDMAGLTTRLALDRTALAWVRTTLTMASFGFGMVAFFRSLRQSAPSRKRSDCMGGRLFRNGADPARNRVHDSRRGLAVAHASTAPTRAGATSLAVAADNHDLPSYVPSVPGRTLGSVSAIEVVWSRERNPRTIVGRSVDHRPALWVPQGRSLCCSRWR